LTYIFAADSTGLCSLLYTQLCLKVAHSGPVAPTKLKFKYHLNPEIIVS